MQEKVLKRTALIGEHQRLQGRLVDFGGWELPVQYTGVMEEHLAARESAGLFDVSHMGEFLVEGPDAESFLNYLVSNNVSKLMVGQAQYTVMCHESGGIVDDLLIYRRGPDRFFVVVNASNTDKDFDHASSVLKLFREGRANLKLANVSGEYSQIAIQGRLAEKILQPLTTVPLSDIKYYWFKEGQVLGDIPAILARTGYTGEDGFELYVPWATAPKVWLALLQEGSPLGLKPCGLGARDTLRLEMKYPLYGHELNDETNPLEAGLGWVVKLDKPDFLGKKALVAAKEKGHSRSLVGFAMIDRGIPRQGYSIFRKGSPVSTGIVASGTQSPSLKRAIGTAYVSSADAAIGTPLEVEIRGQRFAAEVVKTPFYLRPY